MNDEQEKHSNCNICGKLVCYADDCTYSSSHKDPIILQNKIKVGFKKISQYMTKNKLFLNSDKTHLLVMDSHKSHLIHNNFGITLDTGSEIIEPSPEERLLGANMTNDFLRKTHLRDHKKSLISTLKTKNNALSIICHYSSFIVRKMLANGLILSHIIYHIELYGGCSEELLSAIQVQQNRAARMVCKLPWRTRTNTLLNQMGWMTVRQMVAFYSLMTLFKTRKSGQPSYIHNLISLPFNIKTRLACTGGIRDPRNLQSRIGMSSFIPRTISLWNSLPEGIRMEESPAIYSTKLRAWVKENVLDN